MLVPKPDRPSLDRRGFLRLLAGAVGSSAGLVAAGCGSSSRPGPPTFTGRAVRQFRSRPDLRPPAIDVLVRRGNPAPGMVITEAHDGPAQQGPMIIGPDGRLAWFKPLPPHLKSDRAFNVRVQRYRGKPVLSWFEGAVVGAHGVGHYVLYDENYDLVGTVEAGYGYKGDLHEFLLTDRGTALLTAYGEADGRIPRGASSHHGTYWYGVVQEVDVATGEVVFQWRSDEHVGLEASLHPAPPDPGITWDYFHVNSIDVDPRDGHLLISARNTWAIYKVHRRTGRVLWTLGGKHSDFAMGRGTHFAFQHHAVAHPDGTMTIFDNEAGPPRFAAQSRALLLRVQERARRASFVRQYVHRPPVMTEALGSVQKLEDGHVFVGWGDSGYFTEYDRSGRVVFDGRLAPGTLSYRAFKHRWTGRPTTPPDLAVARSGWGAKLYASWNGATEVRRWRVLGGPGAARLVTLGTAPRADFETEIHVPRTPAWVAVEALDAGGRPLGRSATLAV